VQTTFTLEQLAQPQIAEADGILKTCVHYGFCTATCPTYVLFRDENDSPRGRIDLIRAMLEKGGPPDAKTVHHLDRCLSCLSCMTTCAVKVDYAHLIDIARDYIEDNYRRPLGERMLRRFRYQMYQRLLRFPLGYFQKMSSAQIIPMITVECEQLGGFIGDAFVLPLFQGGQLLRHRGRRVSQGGRRRRDRPPAREFLQQSQPMQIQHKFNLPSTIDIEACPNA